jgi:hypothetical protein
MARSCFWKESTPGVRNGNGQTYTLVAAFTGHICILRPNHMANDTRQRRYGNPTFEEMFGTECDAFLVLQGAFVANTDVRGVKSG